MKGRQIPGDSEEEDWDYGNEIGHSLTRGLSKRNQATAIYSQNKASLPYSIIDGNSIIRMQNKRI